MNEYWSAGRAGLLAMFVAGLIWIWAEGESLTSRTIARVDVVLPQESAGEFVIRPEDPGWNGVVQVRLEGSVRAVEAAAAVIGERVRLPAALEVMPKQSEERKTIKLADALAELPEMANLRGVVAEVQPPDLNVRAVKMVTRELPVRVELARSVPLDGDPVPTPAMVKVRMPESASAALGESAQAVATLTEETLGRIRDDGPQSLSAQVRLPVVLTDPDLVVISPETVTVSLRPRRAVDSVVIHTVPVWFSLPPTEDGGRWSVEVLDKFIADVTVSGASEDVGRVKSGEVSIKGVVELTTDDLEKGAAEKGGMVKQAVISGVPAGLTWTVPNATVRVRIGKRGG